MPVIEAGEVVGGKYKLLRPLGRGSMGEVWIAHHQTLGEEVAIKFLAVPPAGAGFEDPMLAAERFRFEAQVAARLSRKTRHIVRVTDHGEEGGLAYLVMELLEGRTLESWLMIYGAMAPAATSRLVGQIARGLEYAHAENVVHRDLKPANIFVARDEEGEMLVKVLDFGIARAIRTQRMVAPFSTGEGVIFGTPGYMSPEQACAARLDARADLWALATVAYEALTGDLPLAGAFVEELLRNLHAGRIVPVHARNPDLPAGFADFFAQAFAPRIEHRFASASQLAHAFEQAGRSGARRAPSMHLPAGEAGRGETWPLAFVPPYRAQSDKSDKSDKSDPLPKPRAARSWPILLGGALTLLVMAVVIPVGWTRTRAPGAAPKNTAEARSEERADAETSARAAVSQPAFDTAPTRVPTVAVQLAFGPAVRLESATSSASASAPRPSPVQATRPAAQTHRPPAAGSSAPSVPPVAQEPIDKSAVY